MIIHLLNTQEKIPIDTRRLKAIFRQIAKELQVEDREISCVITDDEHIRELNLRYLKRNKPTNVLSFPLESGKHLGDIVISAETAERDARGGNLPLLDELAFLFLHGLLHLIGYNHEDGDPGKAKEMERKEREIFSSISGYDLD